jgi:hypothetical protein
MRVSYPVTYVALNPAEASRLRERHGAGDDLAVLARARELAVSGEWRVSTDEAWPAIRRCLGAEVGVAAGEPVFGRRDHDVRLIDPAATAVTAAALARVGRDWLRERFAERVLAPLPGPVQPPPGPGFDLVWDRLTELAGFFAVASVAGRWVLFLTPSRFWRPPRVETDADGRTWVVRPPYRPEDYTIDTNSTRSLPADGGSWPIEAELDERDGALYHWTEVERFTRGGRTWVRLTVGQSEGYIDVEIGDQDRIGRIEAVDPLIAYRLARRGDRHPVRLED